MTIAGLRHPQIATRNAVSYQKPAAFNHQNQVCYIQCIVDILDVNNSIIIVHDREVEDYYQWLK